MKTGQSSDLLWETERKENQENRAEPQKPVGHHDVYRYTYNIHQEEEREKWRKHIWKIMANFQI